MTHYDISEQAYVNGLNKGFDNGKNSFLRQLFFQIESGFTDKTCKCGRRLISQVYKCCPECGREIENDSTKI